MTDHPDFARVLGQFHAKRALEVAAAGNHNTLLVGYDDTARLALARCVPGILPGGKGPFRAPHYSIEYSRLAGSRRRPGEAQRAHGGVLYLDRLPEFQRDAVEALREPLSEGQITLMDAGGGCTLPAAFLMVGSMAPCPPGLGRWIPKLLLEHIDIHIEVAPFLPGELLLGSGETSSAVADRVKRARAFRRSFAGRRTLELTDEGQCFLDLARERMGLTVAVTDRVIRVARTIADLAGSHRVGIMHVAEAVQYRPLRILRYEEAS